MAKRDVAEETEYEESDEEESNVYKVMELLQATTNIEEIQKTFKLAGASHDIDLRRSTCVSSGLLMTDLLLNGGIYPGGWYTFLGPEGSAKSTHMSTIMVSLVGSNVPLIMYLDAEGSTSPDYIESIATSLGVQNRKESKTETQKMFGVKDLNNEQNWVIEPRIHYFPENSLEKVWNSVASMLRKLPDKIYTKKQWWLMFDNTRPNISRFKGQTHTKLSKKYGKVVIPALDEGALQALILIDSYPSLTSDSTNTDEGNNALAVDARGHAKYAKLVKGFLKRKHATVIGVNQLRASINLGGNAYGPKEYEPGGNYLKFCRDVAISQRPRAIPHASGQIEEEESVQFKNGTDTYRYVKMQTIKNKYGVPHLEGWYRIWISNPEGIGCGFCPVYDTWSYLKATGQATGSIGKKLYITIEDQELPGLTWSEFKSLILLHGKQLKKIGTALGFKSNPSIRETCFEQIKDGSGIDMYFQTLRDK